jgi:hypothetical protein
MRRFLEPLEARTFLSATISILKLPPLTTSGTGDTIDEIAHKMFTAQVGVYGVMCTGSPAPTDVTAVIHWGDGTTSRGVFKGGGVLISEIIGPPGSSFVDLFSDIHGRHEYANAGTYDIQIVVSGVVSGAKAPSVLTDISSVANVTSE